jgi:ATP-dependent RNA helicase DHX29
VKESRFNASTRIKELVTVWISQASAKQRSGRAGRTSPGTCWRLYSKEFYENEMTIETAPEMVRTPLDDLILQICLLYEQRRDDYLAKQAMGTTDSGSSPKSTFPMGVRPIQFLSKTPSPPPLESLAEGCQQLLQVDALRVVEGTGQEDSLMYRLTPLGYHLSRLPMDAKVGKVLLVGCILGCLDSALTVAAALSCTKSCFLTLMSSNRDTRGTIQARKSLVENGFGGNDWPGGTVKGDLIAMIAVFRAWKKKKSDNDRRCFCESHGLAMTCLTELDQLQKKFLEVLGDAGIVPRDSVKNSGSSFDLPSLKEFNQASDDALLTSCCLIAGLYPNICTLMRPRKGGPRGGRLLTKEGDVCRPHFSSFQRTRIQQAAEVGRDAYAVFHAKQKIIGTAANGSARRSGSAVEKPQEVLLTEVNFVSRFALLLFGSELHIVKNAIIVDGWLKFKVTSTNDDNDARALENAVLLVSLREAVDKVVSDHVMNTNANKDRKQVMMARQKSVIQVIRKLLAEEGGSAHSSKF